VKKTGIAKNKIHVLEALLRLRQAACHPGLVDESRRDEPSGKLEVLLDQLDELREAGHKALVFSQFTSLLAIVRRRLDERGVRFGYLDGKTVDRAAAVAAFQDDPGCSVFLLSLKAGGVGLNLTAAGYVFLLDPWWNPAVEAQAIDRAHRIGQTQAVFAYRLVAENTIEQKIAELQAKKRALAAALVRDDASVLEAMSADDLELLLG
jgi:SNF2 family DNA or RNA helicase